MFKEDDEMDFEDFKQNISNDPIGEYEQDELLESCRKNFHERIKNKEVQKIYNEAINEPGPKKIFKMITDFKYAFDDDNTGAEEDVIMRIASSIGMNLIDMFLEKMVNEQLKYVDRINNALVMTLAVANKGKCKDNEIQRYLIDNFKKIKNHFGKCGELSFMAFCSQLIIYEHFVDEMIFKEKVYTEIAQIEQEPIPEKK